MENINNAILVNYNTQNTSASDITYETPTELTDNLSFAIKNNVIIDYSLAEIEKSDVNKDSQEIIIEE
ncbi:MAG: hypothetical protein GXO88_11900 [Chlorobi bacterium]|nr:hypothetical protein [Chlorobiota bacterium]